MQRSGTRGMLREDGCAGALRERGRIPGVAARLGRARSLRHRLPASAQRASSPTISRACRSASSAGTFVPGWKTVSDPKDLGKAIWRYAEEKGARLRARRRRPRGASRDGAVAIQLRQGAHCQGATDRDCGRRLVAPAGAAARRPHAARDRARLQHDAAAGRLRRASGSSSFGGHGFVITPLDDRPAHRRRGRTRRPRSGRPNFARSKAMLEKAKRFLPGLEPTGGTRMDGLPPVAARLAAGHRPSRSVAECRTMPSAMAISA